MTIEDMPAGRKYWIARGNNFQGIEVEFFTDPLAYGRGVKAVEAEHARGEVDTYTHGSNMINFDKKNPVFGELYIASMGDMGADVQFFDDEAHYMNRLEHLKEDEYYERVDALAYNGPDYEFDPDATVGESDDGPQEQPTARAL